MSRLYTIGSGIESPTNTFNIVASTEMTLSTGLGEVEIVVNTDGSFSADLLFTFAFTEPATDFPNDTEWVKICGDYKIETSTLPAAVGVEIGETLFFSTSKVFDDFVRQLRTDFSMELKLK